MITIELHGFGDWLQLALLAAAVVAFCSSLYGLGETTGASRAREDCCRRHVQPMLDSVLSAHEDDES